MTLEEQVEQYITIYPNKYTEEMLTKFIGYWGREQKTKPKWMHQKTFNIKMRLAAWHKNEIERYPKKNRLEKFRNMVGNINPLR